MQPTRLTHAQNTPPPHLLFSMPSFIQAARGNLPLLGDFPGKPGEWQEHSLCVQRQSLNHVRLFVVAWAVAHQAPLPMEFSRREYRSGLPFPSPRDLPRPRGGTWVSCIVGELFTL